MVLNVACIQFFIKTFFKYTFCSLGEIFGFKMKYVEGSRSYHLFIHDKVHIKT